MVYDVLMIRIYVYVYLKEFFVYYIFKKKGSEEFNSFNIFIANQVQQIALILCVDACIKTTFDMQYI